MRTNVDLTDKFVLHVPAEVPDMTVRIPVPDSAVTPGINGTEVVGALDVTSTQQPYSSSDSRDAAGNLYRVLVFRNPSPGDMTIEADFDNLEISTDLGESMPRDRFPLSNVPSGVEPFLHPTRLVQSADPDVRNLAQQIAGDAETEAQVADRISTWMVRNMSYGGSTDMTSDAVSTLDAHASLCEGWAHLFLAIARANGIPARFVGGYTIGGTIHYPISVDGQSIMTVTTKSLAHAWVELWFPGAGWIPYDPQGSAGFVDSHHVRVWTGVDANSVMPLLSWHADSRSEDRLSFVEQQSQSRVTDDITVAFAGSQPGPSDQILLTR